MIPKAADDTDVSFVKFMGREDQTVTFIHSSGIEETENVDSTLGMMLTAQCSGDPSVSTSIRSTIGGCTYDVVVPCSSDLMCESEPFDRRLIIDNENDEAFTREPIPDYGDDEQEDVPYCLAEDFPCEGEEEKMVHFCHYIPRQGYQTFCVPEADTVILEFYPHDYCGPCEGGYGSIGK